MGNCCVVEGAVDHWVYVKIGDRKQPFTDARLRVIVQDVTGKQSTTLKLDCVSKNDFERGSQEVFEVRWDDVYYLAQASACDVLVLWPSLWLRRVVNIVGELFYADHMTEVA